MSEVINTNKYLDFEGLKKYDARIKEYIAAGNSALSDVLSDAIAALDAKIGNLDIEGSDDKTLAEIVEGIYASIAEIVEKQDSLDEKDAELEGKIEEEIGKIVGDLNSLGEGVNLMTLVEVANKLKALEGSVSKNTQDIVDIKDRVTAVEETIKELGKIEGGESLGDIVSEVKLNTASIATLNSDENTEGSVKKTAKDAADAAQAAAIAAAATDASDKAGAAEKNAKDYADSKAEEVTAAAEAAAAQALTDAKADAANLYQVKGNYEEAGAAAQALADAKADAANLYQVKGNYEEAGAAAQALADAKADAANLYQVKGEYEAAGAAAAAIETAAADASTKADAAEAAAIAAAATDAAAQAAAAEKNAKDYVDAIAHASDVKYENGYINLYDSKGEKIGAGFDASPFIVDGMLDTVDFVKDADGNATSILRFTFNVEAEDSDSDVNKKTIDVDFAKYVDVYHADNSSIELNSETNTFSVKEVAATKTKTVDAIPVAGGPLESLLKGAGITEIAAGSSIEDILFSLICKELWAQTLTFSEGTVSSSIAQPSFTLSNSGTTVEVGTICTLSDITMSAATPSVSKNRTYSGFTYGYSAGNDNTQDSADTSIAAGIDVSAALNEGNYTMSRDYTYFNGAVDDSATADSDASKVTLAGAELTVSYVGDNKVKVTVGGPTASATFAAMPVYYACSNLKKTKDATKDSEGQYKSEAKDAKKVTSSAASNSKTLTVTGARAYWVGSVKNALAEFTSATVRAAGDSDVNHLNKALGTNVPTTITATGGDAQVIIATQKEITAVNSKNQIGADVFGNFTHRSISINGANNFDGISYHVYEWTPANPFDKDDILTITYK